MRKGAADLRRFRAKEKLKFTELGKSLRDEGKKEKAIERAKIAIKKGMDNETISELTGLSIGDIELIREVLKQISSYINKHNL